MEHYHCWELGYWNVNGRIDYKKTQRLLFMTFEETGLSAEILKAIGELGFVTPTPVQERSIPEILNNGQDVISLAQTGTGKTGAFGLPIVQLANTQNSETQALILSPTRELCLQISKDLTAFAKYTEKLKIVSVYGGTDIKAQLKALKGAAHIVVGTPGRVIDLINRGALKIGNIRWLVLDEADEMLNMGFQDDIETILAETPETRQTLLFSATMPPFIEKVARHYMKEHIEIRIGRTNQGADTVQHRLDADLVSAVFEAIHQASVERQSHIMEE